MAAQNIGAARWDRIGKITASGLMINVVMTSALVLAITSADRFLLSLFIGADWDAVGIAQHINHLAGWGFILSGSAMALAAVPRANGATIPPLIILTISLVFGQLGLAYGFSSRLGADAIWWSFPAGYLISALLTIIYYRFGAWRSLKLVKAPSLGPTLSATATN